MAGGEGALQWPFPVTVDDEDPKNFCVISLTVEGLKVSKKLGIIGKAKPDNANIEPMFKENYVEVKITLKKKEGDEVFMYKKNLPEDIITGDSDCKVEKNMVKLYLRKKKPDSWAQYAKDLAKKEPLP